MTREVETSTLSSKAVTADKIGSIDARYPHQSSFTLKSQTNDSPNKHKKTFLPEKKTEYLPMRYPVFICTPNSPPLPSHPSKEFRRVAIRLRVLSSLFARPYRASTVSTSVRRYRYSTSRSDNWSQSQPAQCDAYLLSDDDSQIAPLRSEDQQTPDAIPMLQIPRSSSPISTINPESDP